VAREGGAEAGGKQRRHGKSKRNAPMRPPRPAEAAVAAAYAEAAQKDGACLPQAALF